MVKNQVFTEIRIVYCYSVLPAKESKTLAKFRQEGLHTIARKRFELIFRRRIWLRDFQKLKDIGIAKQVFRFLRNVSFRSKLNERVSVFVRCKMQKEGSFFLTLKFPNQPVFIILFFLIETAFQRVFQLTHRQQKPDKVSVPCRALLMDRLYRGFTCCDGASGGLRRGCR